jgi:anaerobic selenocysteine-containing dehydrogenase
MVAIDVYRNETTRHAHLILPPNFGLERDHYPVIFHGVAVRNTAHYAPAILDRRPGSLDDWEILLELAGRLGRARGGVESLKGRLRRGLGRAIGPRGALRLLLRLGPHPLTFGRLARERHGVDLGPLEPRLPGILGRQRRIQIAPEVITRDVPRLVEKLEAAARQGPNGLVLIGRRTLRSNNSWMHNSERLVSGRPRCVLLMSPADAEGRGLRSGQRVVLKSKVGEIEVPLEVSEDMMPGVVSLPHGWGHDRAGVKLSVAAAHAGASLNDVTDDARIDPVSGVASLSGVPVAVSALQS